MSVSATEKRRIYVGGLFPEVEASDLREKFARFGTVDDVQIKIRKDEKGSPVKTFAYLNINGNKKDFDKCFSTFNKAKWKGSVLVLQNAKESFLTRLEKERAEALHPDSSLEENKSLFLHDPLSEVPGVQDFVMRGAVPGTPVPGEKNWVVGKYGRILPIVHLKKTNKKKVVRVDPSKLCHNLKKLKDDGDRSGDISVDRLTWEIRDRDSEMTKKRKGEFPEGHKKSKSAKTSMKTEMVMEFLADRDRRYANIVKEANNFEIMQHDGTVKKNLGSAQTPLTSNKKSKKLTPSKKACSSDSEGNSADTDEIIAATKTSAKKKSSVVYKPSQNFQEKCFESSSDNDSESGVVNASSFVYIPGKKASAKKNSSVFSKPSQNFPEKFSVSSSDSDSESGVMNASSFVYIPGKKTAAEKDNEMSLDSSDSNDNETYVKVDSLKRKPETPVSHLDRRQKGKVSAAKKKINLVMNSKPNCSDAEQKTHNSVNSTSDSESAGSSDTGVVDLKNKCNGVISPTKKDKIHAHVEEGSRDKMMMKKKNRLKQISSSKGNHSGSETSSQGESDSESSSNSDELDKLSGSDEDFCEETGFNVETSDEYSSCSEGIYERKKGGNLMKPTGQKWMSKIPEFKGRAMLDEEDEKTNNSSTNTVATELKNSSPVSSNKIDTYKSYALKESSKSLMSNLDSENSDSADSADTDEILSNFRRSRNTPGSTSAVFEASPYVKKKPTAENVMDEFDCGFLVDGEKIVYPEEKNEETESDSSKDSFLSFKNEKSNKESKAKDISKNITKLDGHSAKQTVTDSKGTHQVGKRKSKTKDGKRETTNPVSPEGPKTVRKELPPLEKHADDNQRRLATLQERKQEIENKKALVQKALAQVDSGSRLNKKIIFDSDDDDDEMEENTSIISPSRTQAKSSIPLMETSDNDDKKVAESSKKKKHLSLFDSSDSDEDDAGDSEDEKMFRIRPQYEGDRGKKLMELQSRFGNDDRFKITERFVDSDDEEDTKDVQPDVEDADQESERSRSLRILQDVVGRQPVARLLKQESQRKTFKDVSTLHFDPAREEHSQFEVKAPLKEKVPKKKNQKKSMEVEEPEVLPDIGKERSYEVSSNIQDAFTKTQEQKSSGFSLLAAFGKKTEENMDTQDTSVEGITQPSVSMNPWENRFSVDSSNDSSDDEEESQQSSGQQTEENRSFIPARKSTFFFWHDDDIRLKEGIDFFRRPDDFESVVERWREQRPKLIESYKEKLRKAVKNKRKLQMQKNPVRRFGTQRTGRHRNEDT